MKQIKGKVDFYVIPVTDNKEERVVDFKKDMPQFAETPWFYLNSIKENEASLFVDEMEGIGFMRYTPDGQIEPASLNWKFGLKTAKESLVSLFKANDCWIKEWKKKPEAMLIYEMQRFECTADEMWRCREWKELPDDFLIIKLN